jgi:D-alanine transaminase
MPIINEGLRRSGLGDAMVYIQVTRGTAPRSHEIPVGLEPTVVMTFKPLPGVPQEWREKGIRAMTTPDRRWANCYIKAITLLPNVLAKHEAIRRGYDEAIFVTDTGEVRECTSANVFAVHGPRTTTPCRTESILHGITQGLIFQCAAALDLDVEEQTVTLDSLRNADEVFISGTTVEVLAITSIDGLPIGDGRVGPVTQRVHGEFKKRCRNRTGGETTSV